ncbi:MAG: hypothetical protein QXD57_01290 [Ignisphaera sp.]
MRWLIEILKLINIKSCILIFTSMLIISTVLLTVLGYLQSLYNIYEVIVYPEVFREKPVVVVSSYALAPFTSLVSTDVLGNMLRDVQDVEYIFYQILVIAYINNSRAVIVRGIEAKDLKIIADYRIIDGRDIDGHCFYCIWVGKNIAEELNIHVGDVIVLSSPFLSIPLILRVSGIIDAGYPYNYELLSSISLAQSIRGVAKGYVSMAVVVFSSREDYLVFVERLGLDRDRMSLMERAIVALKYIGREIRPHVYEHMTEMLVSRLGLPRDIYILISFATAFIMSIGLYMIGQSIATMNSHNLEILYEQGVSSIKIKISLAIVLVIFIATSIKLSLITTKMLSNIISLTIVGYPLKVAISKDILLATSIYILFFTLIGLATVKIHGYREETI